ncbi:hypothetical protein CDAR_126461 [Caerostris darwini]|uniref:Uncharacterized protein n=1 Tax=Caerostris darwini TaxID=1538125 RepID=A0AAV4R6Z4_9ARAC|nr:hypothetical protein CDAR_126461 [Caerostris darwini]
MRGENFDYDEEAYQKCLEGKGGFAWQGISITGVGLDRNSESSSNLNRLTINSRPEKNPVNPSMSFNGGYHLRIHKPGFRRLLSRTFLKEGWKIPRTQSSAS